MFNKIKELIIKYKSFILYAVFGVLTTLINIGTYILLTRLFSMPVTYANVIAWIACVTAAYLTNRKWVFDSQAKGLKSIFLEFMAFIASRVFSGLLDIGIMFLFVEVLDFPDIIVKVLVNIIVIIVNYVLSRLVVFRKKNK